MAPLFDYKCDKCGAVEEQLRAYDDRHTPKKHGVACEGTMQLQVSAPARTSTRWGDTSKFYFGKK